MAGRTPGVATTAGRSGTCPATAPGNASRRHGRNAARSATSKAFKFLKSFFFRWSFDFVYFMGRTIHKFNMKYLLTFTIFNIIRNP